MRNNEKILAGIFGGLGLVILVQARLITFSSSNAKTLTPQITKAQADLREATASILVRDKELTKYREGLNTSHDALMSILITKVQPSIRANQLNASERMQAALDAIDQAKVFSRHDVSLKDVDASQARFDKAIERYAARSRTRRANEWSDQAETLFEECVIAKRKLVHAEDQKEEALNLFEKRREILNKLQDNGMVPFMSGKSAPSPSSAAGVGVLGGLLSVLGLGMIVGSALKAQKVADIPLQDIFEHIRQEREEKPPETVRPREGASLEDILQCVEAAAAGDLTRVPEAQSTDILGQLAKAVGRLITVLARSENLVYHLAALIDSSGEAIISHTLDGKVLTWNKGAQRMYGYSIDEVKGHPIAFLSPRDGGAEMMLMLHRLRAGEKIQPFETTHQARNGRSVRALVRVSPILDSTRRVIGASFCAQDLTDVALPNPAGQTKQLT